MTEKTIHVFTASTLFNLCNSFANDYFNSFGKGTLSSSSGMEYNRDYRDHFDNYSTLPTVENLEQHEDIIKWLQFSMTLTGFIGNLVSYITLSTNGQTFTNPTMLKLLKNQSVLDSIVCFIGGIFVLQPPMWRVSDHNFSYFICQVIFLFIFALYQLHLVNYIGSNSFKFCLGNDWIGFIVPHNVVFCEWILLSVWMIGLPVVTGRARLIRSHSSARFCFELSGNLN